MTVDRELQTLRHLHASLDGAVSHLQQAAIGLDEAAEAELWTGPQADRLRRVWETYREAVGVALPEALRAALADVRAQHNNLASATGEPDRL